MSGAADPYFTADGHRLRLVRRIPQGHPFAARMIGIADTGVLADHRAVSNGHPGERHDVYSARDHHTVADLNRPMPLRLQVEPRVQQEPRTEPDIPGSMNFRRAQNHNRRIEAMGDAGRQRGMRPEAC